jgi:lipopolysaccharide transport system ATP-binding protein
MAQDVAVRAEGLGKKFLIGHADELGWHFTFRDKLVRSGQDLWRKPTELLWGRGVAASGTAEEFWALKDVSFEVTEGEVVGIIGRNGAGKSTLLKILSRITDPTEGRIVLQGRVASLLEVGTGFHPELTGRENIFLNGAILGMSRREITRKFDEIVAFAEVEKFLDTPVKRYSSGMYVRLAFAVAAHLEPEILIIDEVLAVGDAEFQKKCLGKMDAISRREGRTVLVVSHNMGVITSLCPTAIWLDAGCIRKRGAALGVVGEYLSRRTDREQIVRLNEVPRAAWAQDDRLRLTSVEWLSDLPLRHGESVKARIKFTTRAPVQSVAVGIGFSSFEGTRLLTYETDFQDGFRPDLSSPGNYVVDVAVDSLPLAPDLYNFDVGCRSGDFHGLDYLPACSQVEVIAGSKTPGTIVRKGAGVRLPSEWSWDFLRERMPRLVRT